MRKAGARSRGLGAPAVPGRAGQADLGERVEGSLAAVAAAPDHAGEREPAQPRRSQGAQVPDGADRAALLRRGRRSGLGVRPPREVTRNRGAPLPRNPLSYLGTGELRSPVAPLITREAPSRGPRFSCAARRGP